jgi:hypothetical protein
MELEHREVAKAILKDQGFNTHDFEFNWNAMLRGKNIAYKYSTLPESNMPLCTVTNVLADPQLFIDLLKEYPAIESDSRYWGGSSHHIGYKQSLNAQNFLPMIAMWKPAFLEMFPEINWEENSVVTKWNISTNIYSKEMHPAFMPHHDGGRVSNLWLTRGLEHFGTGFYRLKMDGRFFYHVKELTQYMKTLYLVTNKRLLQDLSSARFWEENPNWELYAAVPAIYNSAVVYDGNYFHAGLGIPEEWPDKKVRYSLISFYARSIEDEPSRVKEDETI